MLFKRASYIFYCLYFFASFLAIGQGETKIISPGSYIVDMGVEPQTIGNALKPYGLIYQLVSEEKIPVVWSIKENKSLGDTDFTYQGTAYKGGPFIIESRFIDDQVEQIISEWEANGVIGLTTTEEVEVPVYDYVVSVPEILVFSGKISEISKYLNDNAGISISNINFGLPNTLESSNSCSDLYILGDVKAQQNQQSGVFEFITERQGNIFAQGKSASTLEALDDPGGADFNFLSELGLRCYKSGECPGVVVSHNETHTPDVHYKSSLGFDPQMQFMGKELDLATENNSISPTYVTESWYLPFGNWRASTQTPLTTEDTSFTNDIGSKVAFGRVRGRNDFGRAMYVAGNDLASGTAGDVAAQRLLLNYILLTGIDKTNTATITGPENIVEDISSDFSASFEEGFTPSTYTWRTTCSGVLSESGVGTIVPEANNNRYTCELSVVASDACGRSAFASKTVTVYPTNETPGVVEDEAIVVGSQETLIDILANDSDPQPDDRLAIQSITQPQFGSAEIVDNKIKYTGFENEYISDTVRCVVCDDHINPLCTETRLIIINELQLNTAPQVVDQTFSISAGPQNDVCIEASDAEGDDLEITEVEYLGTEAVVSNESSDNLCFSYKVDEAFKGTEQVRLVICDIRENFLCKEVFITLLVDANSPPEIAEQTFNANAGESTTMCIEASDPDGDPLVLTEISYRGMNGRVENGDAGDLCFIYQADDHFSGIDEVTIKVCDTDQANALCVEATISIVVQDLAPPVGISRALTPDGNGDNDVFYIENIEAYPGNVVQIYDRWGGLVFQTTGYNNASNFWSGSNGNKQTPAGTYFYLVEIPETGQQFKGYVELIK